MKRVICRPSRQVLIFCVALLSLSASDIFADQNQIASVTRIDTSPVPFQTSNVYDYKMSPDGAWIVYRETFNLVFEMSDLYAIPSDGSGAPVRISNGEGTIHDYMITPDSSKVVYYAKAMSEAGGASHIYNGIYVADILGDSLPQRQRGYPPLPGDGWGEAHFLAISSDGKWLAMNTDRYLIVAMTLIPTVIQADLPQKADHSSVEVGVFTQDSKWWIYQTKGPGHTELKIMSLEGMLWPPFSHAASNNMSNFVLTPDGSRLLYTAANSGAGLGVYSVNLEGTPTSQALVDPVSGGLQPNSEKALAALSADGSILVFSASDGLYSLALQGGASPVRITKGEGFETMRVYQIVVPSDGENVIFIANPDGMHILSYRAPLSGDGPVELFCPANTGLVKRIVPTPDHSRILLSVAMDELTGGVTLPRRLFSVNLTGPAEFTPISAPMGEDELDLGDDFAFSPDGTKVVYRTFYDLYSPVTKTLWMTTLDGSAPPVMLDTAQQAGEIASSANTCIFTPAGNSVIIHRNDTPRNNGLYMRSLAPGAELRLMTGDPITFDERVAEYRVTPDGNSVLMKTQDRDYAAFYTITPAESLEPQLVEGTQGIWKDLEIVNLHKSGRLVYRGRFSPQSVQLGNPSPPVDLSMQTYYGGGYPFLHLSADGTLGFFAYDNTELVCTPDWDDKQDCHMVFTGSTLMMIDLRQGGSASVLADYPGQYVSIYGDATTPDDRYLVYWEGGGVRTISLDKESSKTADPAFNYITQYKLTPDGSYAIFSGSAAFDEPRWLHRKEIGGDWTLTSLSLAGNIYSDVPSFDITADSQHVVFLTGDGYLYAQSIAEPNLPKLLNPVGNVTEYRLGKGGNYVAFITADTPKSLWVAPTDASSLPVRVKKLAAEWQEYDSFEITPDNQWVIYVTDEIADGIFELFAAPTDGSAPPHRLNPEVSSEGCGVGSLNGPTYSMAAHGALLSFCMIEKAYSLYSVSIGNGAAVLRSDPDTEPDSAGQWIGDDIVYQDTPLWGEPVYFEGGVTPVPVEFLPREQGGLYISHLIPREPMVIADEPDSVIAELGSLVTFRISVTGTGPFAYQWFKDGVVVSDAQTPTLTVEASWENAGVYTCKVTDGVDLIYSAPATLVITTPPQEGEDVEGVSPEGEAEGDTPTEGEPVEGVLPEGETVEGDIPEGITPEGLPVEGLSPESSIPEGGLTEGQPSEGQTAEGEPVEGQPSEGQVSEGLPAEGQPSEGLPMEGQVEGDVAPDGGNEEGDTPTANNVTLTGCFGA